MHPTFQLPNRAENPEILCTPACLGVAEEGLGPFFLCHQVFIGAFYFYEERALAYPQLQFKI